MISFTVSAYAQDFTAAELAAVQAIRQSDLGLTRIDTADGEYYFYLPPAEVSTPDYKQVGAMLWRYDGQQMYPNEDADWSGQDVSDGQVTYVERDSLVPSMDADPDAYFGVGKAVRTDKYGRRWVLDYVDR